VVIFGTPVDKFFDNLAEKITSTKSLDGKPVNIK